MSTTVGHIRGIVTLDTSGYKAKSAETRADAKTLKADVEAQKPKLDADAAPFVEAVAKAEAAQASLNAKVEKTITGLELKMAAAADAQETALGRVRTAQAALDALRSAENVPAERLTAAEEKLAAALRGVAAAERNAADITAQLTAARTQAIPVVEQEAEAEDEAAAATVAHTAAKLGLVKAIGALPAILAAVGAATGAAALLPAVGVAVAAAMILKSNEAVSDSYSDLAGQIVRDAQAMAAPLEGDLVDAAGEFALAWSELRPEVRQLFADASPAIAELTRGVTGFARGAVPGMAEAVSRSGPIVEGWGDLFTEVGEGVGEFFENATNDAESTGRVVSDFGGVLRSVLGGTGTLFQSATTAFAPYSAQFSALVQQAISLLTQLADGALPALMSSAGLVMDVLSGVLDLIEPISGAVGTSIGVVLSAAAAWRIYSGALDLVAKASVASALTSTVVAATPLPDKMDKAGKATGAAAGAMGMLTKAASPLGIALATVGVLAGTYLTQQQAIEKGADSFVQNLLKGGDAARAQMQEFRAATDQLARLKAARDAWANSPDAIAAGADDVQLGKMNDAIFEQQQAVDAATTAWNEHLAELGPVQRTQAELNLAVAQYGKSSSEAEAAGAAYRSEVEKQEQAQRDAAAATQSHTDKIAEQLGMTMAASAAGLNYESSLLNTERAQKAAADATREHGAGSLEARTANNAYATQLLVTVDALGKKVAAENAGKSASEVARLVTEAQYKEILRLAGAAGNDAPAALRNMIASMDAATLASMGVTARVNETGQAVYSLPGGKEVVLTGDNTDAVRKIQEVNDKQLLAKTLFINVVTRADSKVAAANSADPGMNDGGWVPGDGPDRDDRLVPLTSKEFVVNRRAAAKWGRFLEAINQANGGDVRIPETDLARVPMARMPSTATSTPPGIAGGDGAALFGSAAPGRTTNVYVNMHAIKTLPTAKELRDVLHDAEVIYDE
ncbi:hypothetical protein [Saccharothrix stipae]